MTSTPAARNRQRLAISLSAIALYWLYQLATLDVHSTLPAKFSDVVLMFISRKLLVLAAIVLLLLLEGAGTRDIGLTSDAWRRHLGAGLLAGLVMFVTLNVGLVTVLNALVPTPPRSGPSMMSFFADPAHLIVWLPIGILGGGVVEELERIFVITRMELWLGRPGMILGVVLSSVMFGLAHLYQGFGAALSTAVSGVCFSVLYLRRRSALEPMAAHAFSDILAMTAAMLISR